MSKNILFIPIDNRPVCYELPFMVALCDKNNVISVPGKRFLGDLTKIADIDEIFKFVKNADNPDVIVISLDTIAYGGLIPSRRSSDSFETIKNRVDKFISYFKKKNAQIYAFSSIMRISNNNINEEEKEYWNKWGKRIFEYSYQIGKYGKTDVKDIPAEIIKDYTETRKRNFELNKYYIELAKNGIFERLVFSKDDCSEYGLNVTEAEELKKLSAGCKNIFIKTGADEIPLTLLSCALNRDKKIKIAPVYTNPGSIEKISKYEDISVENSVKSQIETAGGILSDKDNADIILYVNNFKTTQGELVMNVFEPLFDSDIYLPQKPYCVADILNANGSDNNFVSELFKQDFQKNFLGYAGWNTTGNTLGSVLSAALTYFGAEIRNTEMFERLQITRFLDDYAYQANVRQKLRSNNDNLYNKAVKEEMKKYENEIFSVFDKIFSTKYSFPWNRFFEIKIDLTEK